MEKRNTYSLEWLSAGAKEKLPEVLEKMGYPETAEKIFLEGNKVIYCLYSDNTEGAANTLEDIYRHTQHGGIFGVEN